MQNVRKNYAWGLTSSTIVAIVASTKVLSPSTKVIASKLLSQGEAEEDRKGVR